MKHTPQQVASINSARSANVAAGQNPYSGAGATPVSTAAGLGGSTPPATQSSSPSSSGYTPNRNVTGGDSGYTQGKQNIAPVQPPTLEQQYNKFYNFLSPSIAAIQQSEASAEKAINLASTKESGNVGGMLSSQGLMGSTAGAGAMSEVEQKRNVAISQAQSEAATKVADLTKWAIPEAATEYQAALSRNDTLSQNYVTQTKARALQSVKGVAESGTPLDEFKKTNPDQYNNLLQYYEGDENALKADYISAIPALNKGEPIKSGSKLIYSYVDPITRQQKTEAIETGVPLTDDIKVGKSADGGLLLYNQKTGQFQSIGGGNPYYMANQGLLAEGRQQMIESRKALLATRVVGSQIKQDKRVQNFLSIAPSFQRIQAAEQDIAENGINPANAGDLVEAVTQVNSGGGQITEGKLALIKDSKSIQSQLATLKNKITGKGGVIDEKTAQQMIELSTKIKNIYEGEFKKAAGQYNVRLGNVNGQNLQQYNPLTDITSLPSVVSGDYESGLQSVVSSGAMDTSGGQSNPNAPVDNGDGTFTDSTTGEIIQIE